MVLKFSIETDVKSRGNLYIATGFIFSDDQIFWCPDKFVCFMVLAPISTIFQLYHGGVRIRE